MLFKSFLEAIPIQLFFCPDDDKIIILHERLGKLLVAHPYL